MQIKIFAHTFTKMTYAVPEKQFSVLERNILIDNTSIAGFYSIVLEGLLTLPHN